MTETPAPQRVLLPLDGSPAGERLVRQAVAVASARHLTLEGVTGNGASADAAETFARACREAGVTGEARPVEGSVTRALLARAPHCSLVMMTGERHAPTTHVLTESPLETVARHTPVPVWVAHPEARPPERLVVAFHGERKAYHAVEIAANLALAWCLPVSILVVAEDGAEDVNEQDVNLAREELYVRKVHETEAFYERGDPTTVLARHTDAGTLLVMGSYGDVTLLGFKFGRTVNGVIMHARGPLLLCP